MFSWFPAGGGVGPDLEVFIQPTYGTKTCTAVLPGARMEIIF
jgi:hypothetical protein